MDKYIKINRNDNVAVALEPICQGTLLLVDGSRITLLDDIPAGHKFALQDIDDGEKVVKYGYPIGRALENIKKGMWVSERNICTLLSGIEDYCYAPYPFYQSEYSLDESLTFQGYRRKSGDVGIRNELWIVPTVGCVNGVVEKLAALIRNEIESEYVDAVVAYPHNYGCSQLGDDHENTRKILRDLVLHPNAGAVLVVGLGCENNQPSDFEKILGDYDKERIRFMVTQEVDDELEYGMTILRELYALMVTDRREPLPFGLLRLGLKCGGSDGLSGITANPLLGDFSDFLVAQGGTTVLTEVPEMFGAETILMNRCKTESLFSKTVLSINNFKDYFLKNSQPIYENPSPGNKKGGISTLEEKSLGCIQKSGMSDVCDVLNYGDRIKVSGLNLLSAPGNDLVASTALASSGCHMVLFTTGRGTPFGTFVPTVKISTNTALYNKKKNWIDFNAGVLVGQGNRKDVLNDFINYIKLVASGKKTVNEKNNYREIALFKTGVTL